MKAVRLLLAVSVSVWMVGGCQFGCTSAMAADTSVQTVSAANSCHAKHSHDCCAAKKSKKQIARTPRGTMNDCPLVVNATAVVSKSSGHSTDPARGPVVVSPFIENTNEQPNTFVADSFPPNRDPTYLRCCVFLI
ncbi:MAG TPA: hypothetical protein VJ875_05420 [Pyrinomonadaceae bacterium]|nr:hypothetical protein [Pyrinomonadaceae bacterium]